MVKTSNFEPKKPIGIGLRPSLWERIDRYAKAQGKSRNMVIEEVLSLHIPVIDDLRKTERRSRKEKDTIEIED